MSYSAQTEKLRLPQWVQGSKDHPDFLTDVNQAFEKIDGFAQGIDNTVDGLPEQVEEVATILQSVQEDVGEHTEELARQGVRIAVLENDVNSTNGLAQRVAEIETGQGDQDEKIDDTIESIKKLFSMDTAVISTPIHVSNSSNRESFDIVHIDRRGNILNFAFNNLNIDDEVLFAHVPLADAWSAIQPLIPMGEYDTIVENTIVGKINASDANNKPFAFGIVVAVAVSNGFAFQFFQFPGASEKRGSDKTLYGNVIMTLIKGGVQ